MCASFVLSSGGQQHLSLWTYTHMLRDVALLSLPPEKPENIPAMLLQYQVPTKFPWRHPRRPGFSSYKIQYHLHMSRSFFHGTNTSRLAYKTRPVLVTGDLTNRAIILGPSSSSSSCSFSSSYSFFRHQWKQRLSAVPSGGQCVCVFGPRRRRAAPR